MIGGAEPACLVIADISGYTGYLTDVAGVMDARGDVIYQGEKCFLCRCGASANKPMCDGSHASSGFTDAKDPKRVPDRLDTYNGLQVTVLDNRGICQHSGLCTDRLATVFRALDEAGVHVVLSNHDTPLVRKLYADGGRVSRFRLMYQMLPPTVETLAIATTASN